ncbi:MAG TPA: hypothetical protein VNC78_01030 [Actinomycetota bacterium]|nr:hypothetical protein [Actinomycetota bacterium]
MTLHLPVEGWYLLTDAEVEQLLISLRAGESSPVQLQPLESAAALAFRNRGNVPDEHGRCLRLVLHVEGVEGLKQLDARRAGFEPDFRDAPTWRRPGSRAVNIVPLRLDARSEGGGREVQSWLDDPDVAALEEEWRVTGRIAGLIVPAEYRSFVYKTVLSLRASRHPVTVESVLASVARWLDPDGVATLRSVISQSQVDG